MAEDYPCDVGAQWGHRFVALTFLDLVVVHGTMTPRQSARTLLERHRELCEHQGGSGTGDQGVAEHVLGDVFALPLSQLTALEAQFVIESGEAVARFLAQHGLEARTHNNCVVFVQRGSDAFATRGELEHLRAELAATFDVPQPFSYTALVRTLVDANARCVAALLPDVFGGGEVSVPQVTVLPNVPIGGCMIAYDLCFETDPANCRISHPDYNILGDEHRDHMFVMPESEKMKRRRHYAYIAELLIVPSHEIVHVFQGVAKQRDPSPLGWSAEHDASVGAASLMYHVAQVAKAIAGAGGASAGGDDAVQAHVKRAAATLQTETPLWQSVHSIFGDGVVEAVLMDFCREARDIAATLSAAELREFEKLRESFGTRQPLIGDAPIVSCGFKTLLPMEYFTTSVGGLETVLGLCFRGRCGVDTSRPEAKPAAIPHQVDGSPSWLLQRAPRVGAMCAALETFEPLKRSET